MNGLAGGVWPRLESLGEETVTRGVSVWRLEVENRKLKIANR